MRRRLLPTGSPSLEDRRHHVGDASSTADVVGPQHAAAERDAERMGGMGALPTI